ncbi:YojF family protein [Paenibacillus assamensis]|uniref:YojF family protein n=1 Tax=Paenibacillus assamensis TaxID=311244 RepID=UPI00041BD973|nr:YojF family protein [Paenibacillus assamensis]
MQPIQQERVQQLLQTFQNKRVYLHLEMTTGAYASHRDKSKLTASVFTKNTGIRYSHGTISGNGPYRIGLKTEDGWVYAEGLTHWDEQEANQLIIAGHDQQGKLIVCLMLSETPF